MKDELLLFLSNLRKRLKENAEYALQEDHRRVEELHQQARDRRDEEQVRGNVEPLVPWQTLVQQPMGRVPRTTMESYQRAVQDYTQQIQDLLNTKGVKAAQDFIRGTARPPIDIWITPDGRLIRPRPPAPQVEDTDEVVTESEEVLNSQAPVATNLLLPKKQDKKTANIGQSQEYVARNDDELAKDQAPVLAAKTPTKGQKTFPGGPQAPTPAPSGMTNEQALAFLHNLYSKKSTITTPEASGTGFPVGRVSRGFGVG